LTASLLDILGGCCK